MIARNLRAIVSAGALILAIIAAGCSSSSSNGDGSTESAVMTATGAPTVEQAREAGTIARAIESDPGRASEILAKHGMTAESLDHMIFEIAKDPKLTEAYEDAKGTPSSG